MGYYKSEPIEKAYNRFSEKEDAILTATIQLAPHQEYDRDNVYKLTGLGSMFNGTYRFTKVVHTINPQGYFVEAEARMIHDNKGTHVEGGYKNKKPKEKKPKEPVKTKKDMIYTVKSGDTLWEIAEKYCKSPLDWKEIEKANHALLVRRDKRNAKDSGHFIYPGQKIRIPSHLLK